MKKQLSWTAVIMLVFILIVSIFVGCSSSKSDVPDTNESSVTSAANTDVASKKSEYYYVAPFMGHPYIYDVHLGMKYAAEKFGCEIIKAGPNGWDTKAATEAFEQVIPKKPDGIITICWDGSLVPAIKKAREQGIPVIVIESVVDNSGALSYIGLDNYLNGVDAARELIRIAGTSGKLILEGNWGAANTDEKLAGVKDYLRENSSWEIVAEINNQSKIEVGIEGAKAAFNKNPDATAAIGLDSESGPNICRAMEELNIPPEKITIVCNDRQDIAIEYIRKGYIDATVCSKTATQAYMAIAMLELYNKYGANEIPISSDNINSGVNALPAEVLLGSFIINKENVDAFDHSLMDTYDTTLYR